ncbi:MAG: hypothetical protein C4320_06160, partial [Armatimonadota bacterium]
MSTRTDRLAEALREDGVDAFLAWNHLATGYLTNFWEHPHRRFSLLAIAADGRVAFILPALGATTASEAGILDLRPWSDNDDPVVLFSRLAEEWDLAGGILAVDDDMPTRMLLPMQASLPAALFRSGGSLLARSTRRKEAEEVELFERASAAIDAVYQEILPTLRPIRMRAHHVEPSFSIVAGGPNSAKPHHAPTGRPIASGEVLLLDFGGSYQRYHADITRVVHLGPAPGTVREAYDAVYQAHEGARTQIRPGTTGGQADAFARDLLTQRGMADLFVHRLGHGIGLSEHEEPYLVS